MTFQLSLALLQRFALAGELLGKFIQFPSPFGGLLLGRSRFATNQLAAVLGPGMKLNLILIKTLFEGIDRGLQSPEHIRLHDGLNHDGVARPIPHFFNRTTTRRGACAIFTPARLDTTTGPHCTRRSRNPRQVYISWLPDRRPPSGSRALVR